MPLAEIADPKNDYNLNIPRYIDSSEPEDLQDLHAHLHGGIPDRDIDALGGYWDAFPSLRATLFKPNRPGYSDLAVDVGEVQQAILDSDEFKAFAGDVRQAGRRLVRGPPPLLAGHRRETDAARSSSAASATTCWPASRPLRCSTSTTSTSS